MAYCQVSNACAFAERIQRVPQGASFRARALSQRACPARQPALVIRAGETMGKTMDSFKRNSRASVRCNVGTTSTKLQELYTTLQVADFMTSPCISIRPETTVEEAIELLVTKGISGVPVTDDDGQVLGVISGFDIISLDKSPGHIDRSDGLFPKLGSCETYGGDKKQMWKDFIELKEIAEFANSNTVGAIMHKAYTIGVNATIVQASSIVVEKKVHRLSVLDESGKLVGVLSRGDIMRATLKTLQAQIKVADSDGV